MRKLIVMSIRSINSENRLCGPKEGSCKPVKLRHLATPLSSKLNGSVALRPRLSTGLPFSIAANCARRNLAGQPVAACSPRAGRRVIESTEIAGKL
jgi:hypothetical protein